MKKIEELKLNGNRTERFEFARKSKENMDEAVREGILKKIQPVKKVPLDEEGHFKIQAHDIGLKIREVIGRGCICFVKKGNIEIIGDYTEEEEIQINQIIDGLIVK